MMWIAIGVVVVLVLFLILTYNRLVTLRNRYKNAFSQIDVQLKRRYDLIPNLVDTAKAFMKHERETLEAVIQARNTAMVAAKNAAADPANTEAMKGLIGAESTLTGALGRLFALSEAYPDLRSNTNMLHLQEELTSTENKIAFARQSYNDSVMIYNTEREKFPTVLVAGPMGFQAALPFETSAEERQAVRVNFG